MKTQSLVVLLSFSVIAAAFAPVQNARAETPRSADGYIRAIENAEDADSAITAYARGRTRYPNVDELHRVYMVRMLKLGLPQVARYPARALVGDGEDNPLALAVLGYMHGRNRDLVEAFDHTIRAAAERDDDPSVLHNAGQLAAWYDRQSPPPEVSAHARRLLSANRVQWMGRESFREGYRSIRKAYRELVQRNEELGEQIDALTQEAREVQEVALAIDQQMRELSAEIRRHETAIDRLRDDLIYGGGIVVTDPDIVVVTPGGYGTGGYTRPGYRGYYRLPGYHQRRYRIRQEIAEHEIAIDQLEDQHGALRQEGRQVLDALREKERRLDALQRQIRADDRFVSRHFRWDPPAVEGVVTPVRKHARVAPARSPEVPRTPADAAAQRLRVADLYYSFEMPERARKVLLEIMERYPDTPAGREAKSILFGEGEIGAYVIEAD